MTTRIEPATDEQKLAEIKEALTKAVWDALEIGGIDLLKATSMFLSNRNRSAQTAPAEVVGEPQPYTWEWSQLMHDSMGGWEQKMHRSGPPSYVRPENIRDLKPLYSTPTQAEAKEAGIRAALKAIDPLADRVFNDNGDMTVDTGPVSHAEIVALYFARRSLRALLTEGEAR